MRKLTGHKVNPANDKLEIAVTDEPGAGGANHRYEIGGFDATGNPSASEGDALHEQFGTTLLFQNGPIAEVGVNGITQEALLAICIDRLECFQRGKYACHENEMALDHLRQAQDRLLERTRGRMDRGVEGTHEK